MALRQRINSVRRLDVVSQLMGCMDSIRMPHVGIRQAVSSRTCCQQASYLLTAKAASKESCTHPMRNSSCYIR